MTEVRFSADLYSGFAIDEAVKIYSEFARFELEKEPAEFIVRVTATDEDVDEDSVVFIVEGKQRCYGSTRAWEVAY